MKIQDHWNQKFNSRNWNPKATNINKGLKDFRKLKGDNLPNDVDGIFIELNLQKVKSLFFNISSSLSISGLLFCSC